MRIAVCEDQKSDRERLILCLEEELVSRKLEAQILVYGSGEALLEAAGQIPFHIYFLDIFMSGINGVTVAKNLRRQDKETAIVFITSSQDYYAEGFAVGAVHYLIKPFAKADISEALGRCLRQVGEKERYIELTVNRENRRILLSDLIWAESKDKVCYLHLYSGECRSYLQLDELERLLDDSRFLRCHRSYLVNMDEVTGFEKGDFCMTDAAKIPARQAERTRLRMEYENYLFEKMRRRR